MISITEALIAGVVQGLTEFLPVSSSGHLVLVHRFFNLSEANIFFDICLHAGTLMAVLLYFGKDIVSMIREKKIDWILGIAIGTIPAVAAALLFREKITLFFLSPEKVSFMFIATAIVLFIGQISQAQKTRPNGRLTILKSVFVGIAQAFALLPGVSRSGMTISAGLAGRLSAENAFKFSFLLSVPAILGALLYEGVKTDISGIVLENIGSYVAGMLSAFIVGLLSLMLLWRVVKFKKLYIFGIYLLFLGIAGIIFL